MQRCDRMSAGASAGTPATENAIATGASPFDDHDHTRRFWSFYLRIGKLVFVGEALATLVYFLLTPHGPHRVLLVTFTSIITLVLIATIPLTFRIASSKWRTHYSFAWTIVAGATVTVAIHLDKGIDSPLLFLLALPLVSAGLALDVRQVIGCGVATLVSSSTSGATTWRAVVRRPSSRCSRSPSWAWS